VPVSQPYNREPLPAFAERLSSVPLGAPTVIMAIQSAQPPRHPFPLQIALRAEKLITGAIFYHALADAAAGQFVQSGPQSYATLRSLFTVTDDAWEANWAAFVHYVESFPSPVLQSAFYVMVMHWDRFIASLRDFILFATHSPSANLLPSPVEDDLRHLARRTIVQQVATLQKVSPVGFRLAPTTIPALEELDLVRNLGTHNEWRANARYLEKTRLRRWKLNDLRTINGNELLQWRTSISDTISQCATGIATAYRTAPPYEGKHSRGA
jgi:hypothetical protein